MKSRYGYFFIGILLLVESVYLLYGSLNGDFDLSASAALIFAISVMFLSLGYLQPQFKSKDERMKVIREKGMFYSYFLLIAYFLLFIALIHFNIINIAAITVVMILASLTIVTVFLSMVVLSRVL